MSPETRILDRPDGTVGNARPLLEPFPNPTPPGVDFATFMNGLSVSTGSSADVKQGLDGQSEETRRYQALVESHAREKLEEAAKFVRDSDKQCTLDFHLAQSKDSLWETVEGNVRDLLVSVLVQAMNRRAIAVSDRDASVAQYYLSVPPGKLPLQHAIASRRFPGLDVNPYKSVMLYGIPLGPFALRRYVYGYPEDGIITLATIELSRNPDTGDNTTTLVV